MNIIKVKSSLLIVGIACVVLYLSYFVVSQVSSKPNKGLSSAVNERKEQQKLLLSEPEKSIHELLVRESSGMFKFFTLRNFSPKYL